MTKFYFNLSECGWVVEDKEGRDCETLDMARVIAMDAARDIMAAEIKSGRLCLACRIDVTDGSGQVMITIPFRDAVTVSGL